MKILGIILLVLGVLGLIYQGVTVKRTVDVAAPALTYALADQTTDFGGPATTFGFRVAQLSAVHGPGHWANGDFNA